MKKTTQKKNIKKPFSVGLTVLGAIYILLYLIPVHSVAPAPFFENDDPLVIAHQGGEHLAPSSTMVAFENSVQLGVDALETDIHMSKDGHLINIHDPSVDRTTDGSGYVSDMTLEELKSLDAGYYFEDEQGQHPFRGQGIELITLKELFEAFPDMRFMIEIKDTNPEEMISDIILRLSMLIEEYDMADQVLIASFDHDIITAFKEYDDQGVAVSGGRQNIRNFVIFHKLYMRNLYIPTVNAIQIPTSESGFDLTTNDVINGAERMGLNLYYWTINDQETMRELLEAGADGIITDRPDLLIEVIESMKN
ncbi:glycerophosphodiester phosphodiesterase [Alkalibacillus aidingensis]|uniref:glycerophosphodiester phosphodiesterase n=1 Tax=Alkalibacillus aidingensis TaxID=2747607 RepID=UPI0016608AA3|nr:glycerophosphodiester phosphodiesterase [Alkalibacillus aidingensis]